MNEYCLLLLQLLLSGIGIGLVLRQIKLSRDDTNNNHDKMNEHMINLHRQLTLIRATMLVGKTQGTEQEILCTMIESVEGDLKKYILDKKA